MPNNPGKHIIDVIPLTRLPLSRQQFYSYISSEKIPLGSLVSISLFRRNVEGIAINVRSDFERFGNIVLKPVQAVLAESLLTNQQLKLAQFISDYYISPLGIVLKHFVPKRVKERVSSIKYQVSSIGHKEITLTKEQEAAINKITTTKNTLYEIQNTKYLLYGPASSGKTETYLQAIQQMISSDGDLQFLVLLPDLMQTPQTLERFADQFDPKEIVLIHSKLSKGAFYSAWEKIRSGEAKIIIGTRIAVFAPFKKLGLIAIDEEHDLSFKQWDMNPRYDARKVAQELATMHNAPLVVCSATPSFETWHRAETGEYSLIILPQLPGVPLPKIEVVDMRLDYWKSDGRLIISEILINAIRETLQNKEQVILFHNRQGMSAFSVCEQCGEIMKCPKCERALVYDEDGTHHCLHCAFKTDSFPQCVKCRGIKFHNIGTGTQKIERVLGKIFPQARIDRVDTGTQKQTDSFSEIFERFSKKQIDILIGTQMITKGWDLPNIGCVGIINADSLFQFTDFRANERAFQHIANAIGRTARSGRKFPGRAVIQTFQVRHSVVQHIKQSSQLDFYRRELEERLALHLPPYSKQIRLTIQHQEQLIVDREARKNFDKFLEIIGGKNKHVAIAGPIEPKLSNIRGRKRKSILISINSSCPESKKDELINIIRRLDASWIVDVDPVTSL